METKIFVLHADNDCQNHNKAVGYKIYSLYVLRKQINVAKAKQWFKSKKIMHNYDTSYMEIIFISPEHMNSF